MTVVTDSVIFALCLGAGFASVYFPFSLIVKSWLRRKDGTNSSSDPGPEKPAILGKEEARELLLQLQVVANNISRDVSAHSATMDSIGEELSSGQEVTGEQVISVIQRSIQILTLPVVDHHPVKLHLARFRIEDLLCKLFAVLLGKRLERGICRAIIRA